MRTDINVRPSWHSVALVSRSGMLPVSVMNRQDAGPTVYSHDLYRSLGRGDWRSPSEGEHR